MNRRFNILPEVNRNRNQSYLLNNRVHPADYTAFRTSGLYSTRHSANALVKLFSRLAAIDKGIGFCPPAFRSQDLELRARELLTAMDEMLSSDVRKWLMCFMFSFKHPIESCRPLLQSCLCVLLPGGFGSRAPPVGAIKRSL